MSGLAAWLTGAELVTSAMLPGHGGTSAAYRLRAAAITPIPARDPGPSAVRPGVGFVVQVRRLAESATLPAGTRTFRFEILTRADRPVEVPLPLSPPAVGLRTLVAPVRGTLVPGPGVPSGIIYQPDPGQVGEDAFTLEAREGAGWLRAEVLVRIAADEGPGAVGRDAFVVAPNRRAWISGEAAEVDYEVRISPRPGGRRRFALVTGPDGARLEDAAGQPVDPADWREDERVRIRWPLAGQAAGHVPLTVRVVAEDGDGPIYWFDAVRIVQGGGGGG